MIDKNQQDRGYEAAALQKVLEEIKTKPHGEATAIFVSYDPEEEAMANVYAQAGFAVTNLNWDEEDPDDNDVIARKSL
jgi:diamine N-acetyltransferase